MSKPDVEQVNEEYFRVFYRGLIFDAHYVTDGWLIGHGNTTMNSVSTEEDVIAWLTAQATFAV